MKKILYAIAFCMVSSVPTTHAATITGFMSIDPGQIIQVPLIDPDSPTGDCFRRLNGNCITVNEGIGSYFAMTDNNQLGSAVVQLQPGTLGAIELGTYQNFVLDPDIPAYDPDGPEGPILPGAGYGKTPVVESDIISAFQFFGVTGFIGTNPISYQQGNSYAAPTASFDALGNLTADMSAWEVMWNGIAFEQGASNATGTYDAITGEYTLDWQRRINGGPFNNVLGFWHLEGTVNPVPVPAAVWLFGSGLFGLLVAARRKAN